MIWNWIFNLLVMSIPPLVYVVCNMYKDGKKKDKIIEFQNKLIEGYERRSRTT